MAHDFLDQIEDVRVMLDRIEEDGEETNADSLRLIDVKRLLASIINDHDHGVVDADFEIA